MAFFNSAVGVLQTLVVALGAGLGIWGAINLLEGYRYHLGTSSFRPVRLIKPERDAGSVPHLT